MKIIIAIVIYDRYDNLIKWFHIWKQCKNDLNAEIVVIHNRDDESDNRYKEICDLNNATYIPHENIGFDVGRFQDVCMNRLCGFPEWERLLWIIDDCFPIDENFLNIFNDAMNKGAGVACMEISQYVKEHIRTTGFMIAKSTAQRLTFPADPITTKQHCYLFEHRDKRNTFLAQVKAMRLSVKMVAPRERSPLFDTGYHRRLKREDELLSKWTIKIHEPAPVLTNKVTVICPVYNTFPEIISSMICQTHKNWELLLIHDGPNETGLADLVNAINDDRIKYIETESHRGNWGHSYRAEYIQKAEGDYILVSNADNHHTPVYLEYMLKGFGDGAVATYCSEMVHSYKAWQVIGCRLQRGYLDCAGVVVKASAAKQVGWRNVTDHSSDWIYFQDLINKYGANSFVKIKGCLLIHN